MNINECNVDEYNKDNDFHLILFTLQCEQDITLFNHKLLEILQWTICMLNNDKEHIQLISIIKLLLSNLYTVHYNIINDIEPIVLSMLTELLKYFSENILMIQTLQLFLSLIFDSLYRIHMILFHNKINKNHTLSMTHPVLRKGDIIKTVFNLVSSKNEQIKINTFNYLKINYIYSSNDKVIVVKTPFVLEVMLEVYTNENQKFKNELIQLCMIVNEFLRKEECFNAKLFLASNGLNLLLKNIYIYNGDDNASDLFIQCYNILQIVMKYFTQDQMHSFIIWVFYFIKKNGDFVIAKQLLEIFNNAITCAQNERQNIIQITNQNVIYNPFICNCLLIPNIKCNDVQRKIISVYICMQVINIEMFNKECALLQLKCGNDNVIQMYINDENEFVIEEETQSGNNVVYIYNNVNNVFQNKKWVDFIVEINSDTNTIDVYVNNIHLNKEQTITIQTHCIQQQFDILIGYTNPSSLITYHNNNANTSTNTKTNSFNVSYVLMYNDKISNDLYTKITQHKIHYSKQTHLTSLDVDNNIICEFVFDNIDLIHYNKSKEYQSIINELKYYGCDAECSGKNKYIPYIQSYSRVKHKTNMYLVSKMDTIGKYYCSSYMFQIEEIHKATIKRNVFGFSGVDSVMKGNLFIERMILLISDAPLEESVVKDGKAFYAFVAFVIKMLLVHSESRVYFMEKFFPLIRIFLLRKLDLNNLMNKQIEFTYKEVIEGLINESSCSYENEMMLMLLIIKDVFFDELMFVKLSVELKQLVINKFNNLISQLITNNKHNESNIYEIIIGIFVNITSIISHFEIVNQNIFANLMNIISQIITFIYSTKPNENYLHIFETEIIFYIKLYTNFIEYKKTHRANTLSKDNFIHSDIIYLQLKSISSLLQMKIQTFNSSLLSQLTNTPQPTKPKDKKQQQQQHPIDCIFCKYITKHFTIFFTFIKQNNSYIKTTSSLLHSLYLSNKTIQHLYHNNEFTFVLTSKETVSRKRTKFILKHSDMIKLPNKNNYIYIYTKEYYEYISKLFEMIFAYGVLLDDPKHIVKCLSEGNKFISCYNCLYIKKMLKTNCLCILTDEYIYIYTNIIIDRMDSLHVSKGEFSSLFWARNEKNYIDEWDHYCFNTHDKDNSKNKFKNIKASPYKYKNNKYSIKRISYKNISELYRRVYLHIENSIEIIMKDGSSYFIVFNIDKRDEVYINILNNIEKIYVGNGIANINALRKEKKDSGKYSTFYMRHSPFGEYASVCKKSMQKYKGKNIKKELVDIPLMLKQVSLQWRNNLITNFDYIMLLNTLGGRTYNDLSQYLIFPWIIKDFFNELTVTSNGLYRDLKYPIFAQDEDRREAISMKYELKEEEELKYHCGTFYSTHAFVSYYLIRQCPFAEIGLEIQGGHFDSADRLFHSLLQISSINEKFQEIIPELFYLPELFMNTNEFNLGKTQQKKIVSDVLLPKWSQNDPRMFIAIHKKLFEHKKVSENLHLWIDMIFGYRREGKKAIEICSTYRKACYTIEKNKIEKMNTVELDSFLYEAEELGVHPNMLFTDAHKPKSYVGWFEYNLYFFDTWDKLLHCIVNQLDDELHEIKHQQIGDVACLDDVTFTNNYQGGISSLYTIMKANNTAFNVKGGFDLKKKVDKLNNNKRYVVVPGKGRLLGKNGKMFITYCHNILRLVRTKLNVVFEFVLDDEITAVKSNLKGSKLYIGFSNGEVKKYKVKVVKGEYITVNKENKGISIQGMVEKDDVIKHRNGCRNVINKQDEGKVIYSSVYYNEEIGSQCYIYTLGNNNSGMNNNTKGCNSNNNYSFSSSFSEEDKKKSNKNKTHVIIKRHRNFYLHQCHTITPQQVHPITLIALNEPYDLLISVDSSNRIYLYSARSLFLINTIDYLCYYPFPIKQIIPIKQNGDFLVSTSYTVNLFSLNGVPFAELNLNDKVHSKQSLITCIDASYYNEVLLFTGHKNGKLIIWKIRNKDSQTNFNQRVSFQFNQGTSKYFLEDFKYAYKRVRIDNKEDYEMRRKLDIVITIDVNESNPSPLMYIKLNYDMSQMIIFDKNSYVYCLGCSEMYLYKVIEQAQKEKKGGKNNDDIFAGVNFDDEICLCCQKEINTEGLGRSSCYLERNDRRNREEEVILPKMSEESKLCEECIQMLNNSQNFLYGY